MAQIFTIVIVLAPFLLLGEAACVDKQVHMPWDSLTAAEKSAFIDAELCLMAAPSQLDLEGAETRWDDLHWNHIFQPHVMHDVGHFLPWHRYYVALHGHILRDECDYTGPIPYWDETADDALSDILDASIFQEDAFGGDGSGRNNTIEDGPFVNTTLRMQRVGTPASEYGIYRNLNARSLSGASEDSLNSCFQLNSYSSFWECLGGLPHSAGHGATGGLMLDVSRSPGDPVFYLHHGWLDVMWWKWQTLEPERLTDIGGRNLPRESYVDMLGMSLPGPEWTDYSGDPGDEVTLNHVLYSAGLAPNVTVGDIMDVGGETICAEYIFSDSYNVTMMEIVDGVMKAVTK